MGHTCFRFSLIWCLSLVFFSLIMDFSVDFFGFVLGFALDLIFDFVIDFRPTLVFGISDFVSTVSGFMSTVSGTSDGIRKSVSWNVQRNY